MVNEVGKLRYANKCSVDTGMLWMVRVVPLVELLQGPEHGESVPLQGRESLNLAPYRLADLVEEGLCEYPLVTASDEVGKEAVCVEGLVSEEVEG